MGVKFTDLFALAQQLGADCLATGHYVQRVMGENGPELHRAVDASRDQSYFLFATTPEQLDFLRFPLGGMTKPAVRELARKMGVEMPICEATAALLAGETTVDAMIEGLLSRPLKAERE